MRFGILAHSAEGAALCFLTFCREGFRELGAHMHPDVMLDCEAMGESCPLGTPATMPPFAPSWPNRSAAS